MAIKPSYVGPGIPRYPRKGESRRRATPFGKASVVFAVAVVALLFSALAYVGDFRESDKSTKSLSVTTLGLTLTCQYYDTVMPCLPCLMPPPQPGPHTWNHSSGPNGTYGDGDDCPHCSAYCAPASISMIANYRSRGLPFVLQDFIYDSGKMSGGEIPGNMAIETHGVGMFHGVGGWPVEVQNAMAWSVGFAITQHDRLGTGNQPMSLPLLIAYMAKGTPILWLDNGGWPVNQSALYPSASNRMDQGHAKVIGGHDDGGTQADPTDDLCLIYDPWPEYNDTGIVPVNCTRSSGGVCNPYWQPLNDINFGDLNDVYLVDGFPAIPEYPAVIVPIVGMMAIVAVSHALRRMRGT